MRHAFAWSFIICVTLYFVGIIYGYVELARYLSRAFAAAGF